MLIGSVCLSLDLCRALDGGRIGEARLVGPSAADRGSPRLTSVDRYQRDKAADLLGSECC